MRCFFIIPIPLVLASLFLFRSSGELSGNTNWRPDPSFAVNRASDVIVVAGSTQDTGFLDSYSLASKKVKTILRSPFWICDPDASADIIVFSKIEQSTGIAHVYVCSSDGTNERQLTYGASYDRKPILSPDTKYVYFIRFEQQGGTGMGGLQWLDCDLYRCRVSGGAPERLTFRHALGAMGLAVMTSGEVLCGFETYNDATSGDMNEWLSIANHKAKKIKWLKSWQISELPNRRTIYYLSGVEWNPDIWKKEPGAEPIQATSRKIYIQQFAVLGAHDFLMLAMLHREDKHFMNSDGSSDIYESLVRMTEPSQHLTVLIPEGLLQSKLVDIN